MLREKSTVRRLARAGVAAALTAAGMVTVFEGTSAAAATYRTVPTTGPSADATFVIQVTGTGFTDAAGTSQVIASGVVFATTCGADNTTDGTHLAATAYSVVDAKRMVVTTPSLTLTGSKTAFKVCVYKLGNTLMGSATYTIYAPPTVTSITPNSGGALGGNTVTVVGTGFTSKSKATIDGVALSKVKVSGSTSLTGIVPAHIASSTAVDVVVTTEGGPSTGGGSLYTYKNAITVSPTFGTAGAILDIRGVGFSSVTWGTSNAENSAAKSYVYFVKGVYDPTDATGSKTLGQTETCTNIQVVSDSELVCTVPTMAAAAYTVTIVANGSVHPQNLAEQSVVSSESTFTYANF